VLKDKQQTVKPRETSPMSGKPYFSPKLTEFGHVGQLTQAGTGAQTEQKPGQGPGSKRP